MIEELVGVIAEELGAVLVALAVRLVVALLTDAAAVACLVAVVVVAGRLPAVRRVPYVRTVATALDAGAGRLVVAPVQRMVRTGVPPKRVLWLLVGVVLIVAGVPPVVLVVVVLAVLGVVGHAWGARTPGWWTHATLAGALVESGVLRAPRDGEAPPSLSYRGNPRHDEHGTTVTVALPGAATASDVKGKRERLAAALRVPVARLTVSQDEEDPANVVRFHVGTPDRGAAVAEVATAASTRWADPVMIGRDAHGQPVTIALDEQNTLIAGRPGSGKTSLARVVLGHALLAPDTQVHALDGKGSSADYGAAVPLCTTYVSGTDDDAVPDTVQMLRTVLGIVRARNGTGGAHPGVLLLLEEFQDVRAAASKAQREDLDTLLGRIVRMGRAVSVHVLISTQRPSVDDLPSGVRNLVSQRVALALRNGADAALVLGATPSLTLPRARGQAVVDDGTGQRGVKLDRLTDDAWTGVCQRAKALRTTPQAPQAPQVIEETTEAPTDAPDAAEDPADARTDPAPLDPVLAEALRSLCDGDPRGITATDLHRRLPGWTRVAVPDPRALGLHLANHPAHVVRANVGKARVWKATAHGRVTLGALSEDPRRTPGGSDGAPAEDPRSTVARLSENPVSRSPEPRAVSADSTGAPTPTPAPRSTTP